MKITETKLQEIKKALKDPISGFLNMSRITPEEAGEYFPHVKVGDILVYTYGGRVVFYAVDLLNSGKVYVKPTKIIQDGDLLNKFTTKDLEDYTWTSFFLCSFVCVLRKDQRKFEVEFHKDWYDAWYQVKVDGMYQRTPTGKIQKFGTKEAAETFVKDLVAGTKEFRGETEVSERTWVNLGGSVSASVLRPIPEAIYTGVSGTTATAGLTSTLRYEPSIFIT